MITAEMGRNKINQQKTDDWDTLVERSRKENRALATAPVSRRWGSVRRSMGSTLMLLGNRMITEEGGG